MSDAVTNKVLTIQRCILRSKEEYTLAGDSFLTDFSRQDAAILNVIRACEATIDLANSIIRTRKLGVPLTAADAFHLLAEDKIITPKLAAQMQRMIGFRNQVVHQYASIDMQLVVSVITKELDGLLEFAESARQTSKDTHS